MTPSKREFNTSIVALRHLRFGWWSLLCFLTMGIVLESLHGFKVRAYLDVSNDIRRLMWTLAHAHGTLLALVQLAFFATLGALPERSARWPHRASPCLVGAGVLLPGGFFLGGLFIHDGDPGLGILLVPLGALLLLIGVLLTARGVTHVRKPSHDGTPPTQARESRKIPKQR